MNIVKFCSHNMTGNRYANATMFILLMALLSILLVHLAYAGVAVESVRACAGCF